MKTKIVVFVSLIFGFFLGVAFTAVTLSVSAERMMVKELKSPYDFDKTVRIMTKRINEKPGWHVTTVIDQNEAVTKGGAPSIGKFKIIKYCHAGFSSKCSAPMIARKSGT